MLLNVFKSCTVNWIFILKHKSQNLIATLVREKKSELHIFPKSCSPCQWCRQLLCNELNFGPNLCRKCVCRQPQCVTVVLHSFPFIHSPLLRSQGSCFSRGLAENGLAWNNIIFCSARVHLVDFSFLVLRLTWCRPGLLNLSSRYLKRKQKKKFQTWFQFMFFSNPSNVSSSGIVRFCLWTDKRQRS